MDKFYNDAYSLISPKEAREAFDMTKENDKVKERYGKNQAGQRMLLARRLVESEFVLYHLHTGLGHAPKYRSWFQQAGSGVG